MYFIFGFFENGGESSIPNVHCEYYFLIYHLILETQLTDIFNAFLINVDEKTYPGVQFSLSCLEVHIYNQRKKLRVKFSTPIKIENNKSFPFNYSISSGEIRQHLSTHRTFSLSTGAQVS